MNQISECVKGLWTYHRYLILNWIFNDEDVDNNKNCNVNKNYDNDDEKN